jgi:hypothetical protein
VLVLVSRSYCTLTGRFGSSSQFSVLQSLAMDWFELGV